MGNRCAHRRAAGDATLTPLIVQSPKVASVAERTFASSSSSSASAPTGASPEQVRADVAEIDSSKRVFVAGDDDKIAAEGGESALTESFKKTVQTTASDSSEAADGVAAKRVQAASGPSGKRFDYSKWDKLDKQQREEEDVEKEENDPMTWPVSAEIPWHNMEPVVDKILDEEYGYGQYKQKAEDKPREKDVAKSKREPMILTPAEKAKLEKAKQEVAKLHEERTRATEVVSVKATAPSTTASSRTDPCGSQVGRGRAKDADSLDAMNADEAQAQAMAMKQVGMDFFAKKDYEKAKTAWTQAEAYATKAGEVDLWVAVRANVALVEFKQKRWAAVEQLTTELLEKAPKHEKSLFRRGIAREEQGHLQSAEQDFMRVIATNFMNTEAQDAMNRVHDRLREARRRSEEFTILSATTT